MSGVKMGPVEWALLIALSVLWGGSFFFAKVAVAEIPPMTLVLLRVGLAALALGLYLRATGRNLPSGWPLWAAFFGMGLLNNVLPFGLIFFGQTLIPSGLASIVNATTPVFTMLVAHLFLADERLAAHKLLGVALGVAGVAALMGVDVLAGATASVLGMSACLGAALSYGFAGVFGRRFQAMGVAPLSVAFGQVTASTLIAAPIAFFLDAGGTFDGLAARALALSPEVVAAVLALALAATALAYVMFFRILAAGGATYVSLVTLLVPATAILLGALVLGEKLALNDFVGMGLIALGLLAIDGRFRYPRAKRS